MSHQNGRVHADELHQSTASSADTTDEPRPRGPDGPGQTYTDLAGWILAWEGADAGGVDATARGAERACQKLLERLAKLITQNGCQALVSRALHLARVEFTFLPEIEPGSTAAMYADGLARSAQGIEPMHMQAGLTCLLARLIELVALFIGEYLTGRMLREVWPDLPALDLGQQVVGRGDTGAAA